VIREVIQIFYSLFLGIAFLLVMGEPRPFGFIHEKKLPIYNQVIQIGLHMIYNKKLH
jgi:hypothetical protein